VDADDEKIDDGPIKNDQDVAVFQESVLQNGESVKAIQK